MTAHYFQAGRIAKRRIGSFGFPAEMGVAGPSPTPAAETELAVFISRQGGKHRRALSELARAEIMKALCARTVDRRARLLAVEQS
jgi:hypothetical protein